MEAEAGSGSGSSQPLLLPLPPKKARVSASASASTSLLKTQWISTIIQTWLPQSKFGQSKTSSRISAPVWNVYNHHQQQKQIQLCPQSLKGFLMPSSSTDFNHSKMSSRTPATVRNAYNHHKLQQPLQKCNQSLRSFLMLSNSRGFNQIFNIASSEHMKSIQNVIKDTSSTNELT